MLKRKKSTRLELLGLLLNECTAKTEAEISWHILLLYVIFMAIWGPERVVGVRG